MKSIHSITNVVVGSLLGGLIGFVAAYLVQAFFLGDATISNNSFLHVDTGTGRPSHQVNAIYVAVKYINLIVGVCAGGVIGSIAGATMSLSQVHIYGEQNHGPRDGGKARNRISENGHDRQKRNAQINTKVAQQINDEGQ